MCSLEDLDFDNTILKNLPIDRVKENYVRRKNPNVCFSRVNPAPVSNPKLLIYSDALQLLDLNLKEVDRPEFTEYFSGNKILPGSEPAAHCYCGHQFGIFAGQLGDGRAIYLGEIINHKKERWELQLKGSGQTPYSRDGDGRAVLRSSIREFLCSEAMFHLGIPTTRAGTIILSDTNVIRDIKYDGNKIKEKATIVSRLAPTFIRFGSFQIADKKGPSEGNIKIIRQLTKYVIEYHYPDIFKKYYTPNECVIAFAEELMIKTAKLIALWQSVGFAHGVLNTNNMSIIGLTIDYGPFGFLDAYDPNFICNGSDFEGRYKFNNQPQIGKWNLQRLFDSLGMAFPEIGYKLNKIIQRYSEEYSEAYIHKMRKKLGLFKELPDDNDLVKLLLTTMEETSGDYTNIFRSLSRIRCKNYDREPILNYILHQLIPLKTLLAQNKSQSNIYKKIKDLTKETKLIRDEKLWTSWIKLYKARLEKEEVDDTVRINMMNYNNPKYILRNYLAQIAIEKAEQGDPTELNRLYQVLKDPYDDKRMFDDFLYDELPPEWAVELCITCSS